MEYIKLGRTGLMVSSTSFGALPIQRISFDDAAALIHQALTGGINYFDTANAYTDSEEKLGAALAGVPRDSYVISTKSGAKTYEGVLAHIELSLRRLRTDYIDILQLHNPGVLPDSNDPQSSYAALIEAKRRGWIRFIGITNHALARANAAVDSGAYDTLQYPFSMLAAPQDEALVRRCADADVGFIAMKGMSGGLLRDARAAFVYMRRFPNVVPIWGVQKPSELAEFLGYAQNPPTDDGEIAASIERERAALVGDFCRACGYCLPCPVGIDIPQSARRKYFLMRSPIGPQLSDEVRDTMLRIRDCKHCRVCVSRCPYGLDTPRLLAENLAYYLDFYDTHVQK
ncbi:MAG: aldo/keto reductase [Clostridiaceae bacterium]|nr:aldo/keto reductase [Clostridiaceae bacterium]